MLVVTAITVSLENPQIPLIGLENDVNIEKILHTFIYLTIRLLALDFYEMIVDEVRKNQ